jgi:hypothetical protein
MTVRADLARLGAQATQTIDSLDGFFKLSRDCHGAMLSMGLEEVQPRKATFQPYILLRQQQGRQVQWVRPINSRLFVRNEEAFADDQAKLSAVLTILKDAQASVSWTPELQEWIEGRGISKTVYTGMQSIGCVLDLSPDTQVARKNFGMRFEDLVAVALTQLGLPNQPLNIVLNLPVVGLRYRIALDRVVGRGDALRSTATRLDESELVLSVKTSSKDRMKLIFLDRLLMLKVMKRKQIPYVAVYHNDVQRSGHIC